MRWLVLMAVIGVSGCVDVPELGDRVPDSLKDADYPKLIPLEQALGQSVPPAEASSDVSDSLTARAAGLQRRAGLLRGPVLDAPSRTRLEEATRAAPPDIAQQN